MTVTPGAVLNWTAGEMSGTGTTVISSGATLTVRADTSLLGQRAPTNHGTLAISGAVQLGAATVSFQDTPPSRRYDHRAEVELC